MKVLTTLFISSSLFFASLIPALAQTSTAPTVALRTDLISPSPNAAALGKYGIIPVSMYTGIPNINIPLGEATGRELTVPISLSYHHNGLKNYEMASWVGLGWSVNAGGVITRIVQDKVDEMTPTQYNYQNNIWKYGFGSVPQDYMDGAMFKGLYDTEPDIYTFSFGNYSGKFVLYNGKAYQFPDLKLRITGTPYTGFTIVTPEGTIYSFNEIESTIPKTTLSAYTMPTHNSSWYLSTIRPVDQKETISFNYATSAVALYSHSPLSQSYQKYSTGVRANNVIGPLQSASPTRTYSKRLMSISTPKMTVSFIPQSSARIDMWESQEYALDQIIFSNSSGTIKAYKFNYNYFGNGSNMKTLKLESLDELDKNRNGADAKRHAFVYNDDGNWPVQTSALDHWGYANGASVGPVILPRTLVTEGMDREPHMAYSSLGMLKQIIYPTGGSTAFIYEPNTYGNRVHEYQKVMRNVAADIGRASASDNTTITQTRTFTLDSAQTINILYSRNPKAAVGTGPPNGPDDPTKDLLPELTIVSYESFARSSSSATTAAAPTSLSYTIYYNRDNGGVSTTAKLPAGTYLATLTCDSKEMGTSFGIVYEEQTNIPIEGSAGPGLRIKEITDYATANTTTPALLKKKYVYTDRGGFSTGQMLKGPPNYAGKQYTELYWLGDNLNETTYQLYSSSINSALGDLLDQEMYYSLVNEYQISANTDLRTEHKFESSDNGTVYANTEVSPIRKVDYKKVGTEYVPVQKQEFAYRTVGDTLFSRLRPYMSLQRIPSGGHGFSNPQLREYEYDWASIIPKVWKYKTFERQVTYQGTDSVVMVTNYINDISAKRNLSAIKTSDSKGQERVTKFKYPADYDAAIAEPFLSRNFVSPVIEQQNWLKKSTGDSLLLSGKVDEYDVTLFKPKASYLLEFDHPVAAPNQENRNAAGEYSTLLSDSQYKLRILNNYDAASGNLLAQDLLGRSATKQVSYIWGYPLGTGVNNYPVAACKNGSIEDFFYDGFEYTAGDIQTGAAHTGTNYHAGNYLLNFVIPTATSSYYYSYWSRSGGIWNYSGELKYNGPLTLSGEAFDDVRVYPYEGEMTTYTYFPEIGLSSSTDPKGLTTYYEYDTFQRLKATKDQNENVVKGFDYHVLAASDAGTTPVTPGTCTGAAQKPVNGVCETGIKYYDSSVYNSSTRKYTCTYHYMWSDGSVSQSYSEISNTACNIA